MSFDNYLARRVKEGEVIIVVGLPRAAINEVAAASDNDRADLGARTSDMLGFGRKGWNCEAVMNTHEW